MSSRQTDKLDARAVGLAVIIMVILGGSYTMVKVGLEDLPVFGSLFLRMVLAVAILGDPVTLAAGFAIASGTLGVLLLSPLGADDPVRALATGWTSRAARLGLACGALFAVSSVAYRGAALTVPDVPFLLVGAYLLIAAQAVQTTVLVGWMLIWQRGALVNVLSAWRVSLFAGLMGATASAGWHTAYAIEPVAHVRTLGLVELLFSYAVSRRLFQERLSPMESFGMGLLALGVAVIALA